MEGPEGVKKNFFEKTKNRINKLYNELDNHLKKTLKYMKDNGETDVVTNVLNPKIEKVTSIKLKISDNTVKIMVFGRTSSGKSTVINAMLRENILPSGYGKTTNCCIQIQGVDGEEKYLTYENSGKKEKRNVEEIKDIADALKSANDKTCDIYWPKNKYKLFKNYVVISDCPGIDENKEYDEMLIELCKTADLFISVIDARSGFSMTEEDFYEKVYKNHTKPNIFSLYNFCEKLDKEKNHVVVKEGHKKKYLKFLREKLKIEGSSLEEAEKKIFFISGKEIVNFHSNSQEKSRDGFDRRKTEFDNFEEKLYDTITQLNFHIKFDEPCKEGIEITADINDALKNYNSQIGILINGKTENIDKYEEEMNKIDEKLEDLQTIIKEKKNLIGKIDSKLKYHRTIEEEKKKGIKKINKKLEDFQTTKEEKKNLVGKTDKQLVDLRMIKVEKTKEIEKINEKSVDLLTIKEEKKKEIEKIDLKLKYLQTPKEEKKKGKKEINEKLVEIQTIKKEKEKEIKKINENLERISKIMEKGKNEINNIIQDAKMPIENKIKEKSPEICKRVRSENVNLFDDLSNCDMKFQEYIKEEIMIAVNDVNVNIKKSIEKNKEELSRILTIDINLSNEEIVNETHTYFNNFFKKFPHPKRTEDNTSELCKLVICDINYILSCRKAYTDFINKQLSSFEAKSFFNELKYEERALSLHVENWKKEICMTKYGIENNLTELQKQLEIERLNLNTNEKLLNDTDRSITDLENSKKEVCKAKDNIEKNLTELEKQLKSKQSNLSENEVKLDDLKKFKENVYKTIDDIEKNLTELQNQLKIEQSDLSKNDVLLDNFENLKNDVCETINFIEKNLKQSRGEIKAERKKSSTMNEIIEETGRLITEFENLTKELYATIDAVDKKLDVSQQQLEVERTKSNKMEQLRINCVNLTRGLCATKDAIKNNLNKLQQEREDERKKLSTIKELIEKTCRLKTDFEELKKTIPNK